MYSNSILIDYSDEYTAFYIWRSNDSSDTSFRIIGSTQNKYYIDSGASSGNTYYYKVYAYKMVDGTPYYSDLSDAVKLTVD
jgi:fibronectin type 3 domain-containing protein